MKLPELPFNEWKETRITLHLILQIIGKVRMALTSRKNHWWNLTHYVSVNGFTTSSVPLGDGINTFEVIYDVHKSNIRILTSLGDEKIIILKNGLTVSDFYEKFIHELNLLHIHVQIVDKPFDIGINKRFSEISEYHHFDQNYILKFWQTMLWTDGVFKEFSGRFYGKTCPSHIYWHHMDLTLTRFSGKKAPKMDNSASVLEKDAYSHEVISFGFWAGDDTMPEPAYYSYTFPSPAGLENEVIQPVSANWVVSNGSPTAILAYHELVRSDNPRAVLLDFLESTYQAGAKLARWKLDELRTPPLSEM